MRNQIHVWRSLALAFILAIFSLSASAYDFKSDSLYYNINSDEKTVTVTYGPEKYAMYIVEIPAQVTNNGKTYTVTAIGSKAFQSCKVDSVVMPNTIEEVQSYAFEECTVSRIQFSKGLKHIRKYAFNGAKLTHVKLYEGLETIESYAFADYTRSANGSIITIELPNSVTSIGERCFLQQHKLERLVLPENLTVVEDGLCRSCNKLREVILPKNVMEIKVSAFDCSGLKEITFPSKLKKIGESAFEKTDLESVILPDNIEEMGKRVFACILSLKSITFSKGLKEIPRDVCSYCKNLIEVNIPEGVTTIGYGAFDQCTMLSNVVFPESVTTLGGAIFYQSGISRFTFPSKVTSIPGAMFALCDNLAEITVPSTITSIGGSAFANCSNLKTVVLPETITEISDYMFKQCTALESVNIPSKLTRVGEYAFYQCDALKELSFPKTLEEIGQYCFKESKALKKVTLPHETARYGQGVFDGLTEAEIHIQRAVLPKIVTLANKPTMIYADNKCTLFVPKGAKATYEESSTWNTFDNIVEEDVPDVYYAVAGRVKSGSGVIAVNNQTLNYTTNYQQEYLLNTNTKVEFIPAADYMLKKALCNGEDITDKVVDGVYNIGQIGANYTFEAEFTNKPVTLHQKMGYGGSIDVAVDYNTQFTCTITADEGWKVNSVRFNNSDVTNTWANTGVYTTPRLTKESTLSVSFEQENGVKGVTMNPSKAKAYGDGQGNLIVEGAEGERVSVYSTDGSLLKDVPAASATESIALDRNAVYIVKTENKTIKVAM